MKRARLRSAQRRNQTLKPRNPVVVALGAGQGARAGSHRKTRAAQRRAAKMALKKEPQDD